jgi:hypothetical protein
MNNPQNDYVARQHKTKVPASDLDFNMSVTDPSWGKDEINDALQKTLTKEYFQFDADGNLIIDAKGNPLLNKKALWSMLGFFTRDMRLSNLSPGNSWKGEPNEVEYCEYRLNLANDLLIEGFEECFNIVLERVAAKLELCQSKRGFLRNKMNTYTQENINTNLEPPKRNFMGMKDGGGRL